MWYIVLLSTVAIVMAGDAEDAQPLADANTDFALKFYKKIGGVEGIENIFYSPYSISTALAMASRGAAEETLTEMLTALSYSEMNEDDILDKNMKLLKVLNDDMNNYNMSVANRLFGDKKFKFKADFLKAMSDYYSSPLEKVDYVNKPEEARKTINDWVEEKTNDKIKDLLPTGSVNSMTVLYLVNAIYFGAKWLNPFEEDSNMADQDFHLTSTSTAKVTYMARSGKAHNYPYAELADLDAKLLEMPYKDFSKVAMYVLLPNAVDGLKALETSLKANHLSNSNAENIFSKLDATVKVNVHLPKFEMTQTINPKGLLGDMGMKSAFDSMSANFTRLAESPPLFISSVVHKAFINVHEGGTEAAAATGSGISVTSIDMSEPKEFYADHPYIFFIREKTTGSILFMGRYIMPPQEGGELKQIGSLKAGLTDDPTGGAGVILTSVLTILLGLLSTVFLH